MTPNQQLTTLKAAVCDVACDNVDASSLRHGCVRLPNRAIGRGVSRSAHDASAIIQAAAQAGVSVIPRGAPGTSLSGGAIATASSLISRATTATFSI